MSYSWLPPTLQEIADIAGLDAALAMADSRGGSRVSIPATAGQNNWLVKVVGLVAAEKICKHYRTGIGGKRGTTLDLPLPPNEDLQKKRRKIDAMIASGVSADKIAVQTRTHRTTVFRRKANMQSPKRTPDLFD